MAKSTPPDTGEAMETVTSADGTEIAFARTGSGPPLVLVHGAALDHKYWELSGLRPELAEQNTVYAIERRGRGGSGDAEEYDLEREFEDVAAVVDSIDEPVTLLGHSFGSLIALEAALRTDDLRGLVLYEPFFGPEIPPEIEQLVGAIKALVANGEKEQALITQLTAAQLPEATLEEFRSGPAWQELMDVADTIPREWGGIFEYEFDPDRFDGMTTPTVLFSGDESHPALIAATETVAEGLPNSRTVVFEGTGHWAMNTATDRFIDEVRTFVRASMERTAMAATTTEENKQLVRRALEEYNEQDSAVFDEVFAEDVIDHGPAGETRGREGPRKGLETLFAAFPDLEITIDDIIAEGDTVAVRSTHRGTHEGEFMGIEPTGKQIEVKNSIFARIENGTVVERWVQYDTFGLMQQLGAVDPPGS